MSNTTDVHTPYWFSSISEVEPEHVFVRGYDLEELIGLPYAVNTFLVLKGRLPSPQEARVIDALLSGVVDYALEKSGTVAARAVVSCNPSMTAGLATAILGAGDYSLSPETAAQFIADTYAAFLEAGVSREDYARQVVADASERRFRIPGFGHPVFRNIDPRSERLKSIAVDAGLWGPEAQLYEAIHAEFIKNPKVAHFPINDVGVLAAISTAMGFTPAEATALVVIGTLPGVAAHIAEELNSGVRIRQIQHNLVNYDVPRRDFASDYREAGWTASCGSTATE
jgi:citryl-CoA lyase